MKQLKKRRSSFRSEKIGAFFKTEHFLKRQWERKIPDKILTVALQEVMPIDDKLYVIISRDFLPSIAKKGQELFVIIKNRALITCFFESISAFREKKKNECNYLIISKN